MKAFKADQTIHEVAREQTDLSEEVLDKLPAASKKMEVARHSLLDIRVNSAAEE